MKCPYKPGITKHRIMPLLQNPIYPRLLQLDKRPVWDVCLISESFILIYGVQIGIACALPEQVEEVEVVCGVLGVMGRRRGEGVLELGLFFFVHSSTEVVSVLCRRR